MCKELFKDRGKLNEKKMRVDVGRGGGGRLTSNVSRFTMWKNVFTCSQSFWGAGPGTVMEVAKQGGSDAKAYTQISALWNSGTRSNSATFKPCSSCLTLQRLHFLIYEMVMILSAPLSLCVKWKWHNKYLLSIYYVSGAMIGVKDPGLNKEDKSLCPHRA